MWGLFERVCFLFGRRESFSLTVLVNLLSFRVERGLLFDRFREFACCLGVEIPFISFCWTVQSDFTTVRPYRTLLLDNTLHIHCRSGT